MFSLRPGQKMPTRCGFRPAKMRQRCLLFLRGHVRRLARIEADKHDFIIAPGHERQHLQRAYHALLHLIAQHRAAVVHERQHHRLLLEIFAQLDVACRSHRRTPRSRGMCRVELRFESRRSQVARALPSLLVPTFEGTVLAMGRIPPQSAGRRRVAMARMLFITTVSPCWARLPQRQGPP